MESRTFKSEKMRLTMFSRLLIMVIILVGAFYTFKYFTQKSHETPTEQAELTATIETNDKSNKIDINNSNTTSLIPSASVHEKRIALVIGNSNYSGSQHLKNPVNDANLMGQTLRNLGFEVLEQTNANKEKMLQLIKKFSKKLQYYNVALCYYAGHGVQIDGVNYLLPVDVELNEKEDCKFEAISVNFIVEEFEKYPSNTNIIILDACRNNPFKSWSRGMERGFKAISPPSGTIISFATSEDATASDGVYGKNGLFTKELIEQMNIAQPIENVFKETRIEVERQSNNAQSPQEWSKLKGDFWFKR